MQAGWSRRSSQATTKKGGKRAKEVETTAAYQKPTTLNQVELRLYNNNKHETLQKSNRNFYSQQKVVVVNEERDDDKEGKSQATTFIKKFRFQQVLAAIPRTSENAEETEKKR